MKNNDEEIEKILPPMLPFNFEDKIFKSCTEDCEDSCECSKNPYSMNDWIKSLTDISGVNPELMGRNE